MVCIFKFKNCLRKDKKLWTLSGQILDTFHPLNFELKYHASTCVCFSMVFVRITKIYHSFLVWRPHIYTFIIALSDFTCWKMSIQHISRVDVDRHWECYHIFPCIQQYLAAPGNTVSRNPSQLPFFIKLIAWFQERRDS